MLLKSMKRGAALVVHVILDDFSRDRFKSLEHCLAQASMLDRLLEQYQRGWERPSADEAILTTTVFENGKLHRIMDWAEKLGDGISSTIGHHASIGIAGSRVAARMASRLARPQGLLLILPGYESGFISSVPLEELEELRPRPAAALRQRGVRTLGELAELPRNEARALLGSESTKLMRLVRGVEGRLDRVRASKLESVISVLCRRAARRLEQSRLGARGIEIRLVYGDGVSLRRYTLMPSPVLSHSEVESSAKRVLRLFPARKEAVVGMSLTTTGLSPRPGQLPLFARPREVSVRLGDA